MPTRDEGAVRISIAAAWLAFAGALIVGRGLRDPLALLLAGVAGACFVVAGFAAASRARPAIDNHGPRRIRLFLLACGAGVVLGLLNLLGNRAIAQLDPSIYSLLVERMTTLGFGEAVMASPVVEEIAVRLFLLSAIAWAVMRAGKDRDRAFVIAWVATTMIFALMHLSRPVPADVSAANAYRIALTVKYLVVSLPLGWIFWRWGLPYSIACHMLANGTHLALQGWLFEDARLLP